MYVHLQAFLGLKNPVLNFLNFFEHFPIHKKVVKIYHIVCNNGSDLSHARGSHSFSLYIEETFVIGAEKLMFDKRKRFDEICWLFLTQDVFVTLTQESGRASKFQEFFILLRNFISNYQK